LNLDQPMNQRTPLLSFCTTCKGRRCHLERTLRANLTANRGNDGVEFVLLDYDSPDGLGAWIRQEFLPEIERGSLVYASIQNRPTFHMAHAKNVAHRIARGKILCNLDADNYCEDGFAEFLLHAFARDPAGYFRGKGRGVAGRIACRRDRFFAVGGYDEAFDRGWSWDDADFAARLERTGATKFPPPAGAWPCRALPHSHRLRGTYSVERDIWKASEAHRRLLVQSTRQRRSRANAGAVWGVASGMINYAHPFTTAAKPGTPMEEQRPWTAHEPHSTRYD
jgi:glycosyltransferase involved in cell wall biosynthesis